MHVHNIHIHVATTISQTTEQIKTANQHMRHRVETHRPTLSHKVITKIQHIIHL
jgi:hypothetical protein